jgi:hypothetical protein
MKTLYLLLIGIGCSSLAMAQKFNIGVKAGAELQKLDGQTFKEGFSFGYQLGGFARIGIGRKFGIQPEVLFSQVNIDTTASFNDVYQFNQLSKVKLGYLKIPLLLDYKMLPFLSIQAGPQVGVLIDNNLNLFQNGQTAFKKGDFSMLAGVQANFAKFRVYGRYAIGLNNINDIDNRDQWKSQSVQLGIGLAF